MLTLAHSKHPVTFFNFTKKKFFILYKKLLVYIIIFSGLPKA